MTEVPLLHLSDGNTIPQLAFGTGTSWFKEVDQKETMNTELIECAKVALQRGIHHLDLSEMYGTEAEIGIAIRESGIARQKLFITNKVAQGIKDIPKALEDSLRKVQTTYFDLYLIHVPFFAERDEDLQLAWKTMEELKRTGKVRSIGVSNYLRADLEATLATAVEKPVLNQIEYHPYLQRANDFIPWMRKHEIQTASFKGLTPVFRAPNGPLVKMMARMAQAHETTETAIAIAWLLQSGMVAVTTTTKTERIDEIKQALNLKLSSSELKEISAEGLKFHFRTSWVDRFAENDRS